MADPRGHLFGIANANGGKELAAL
ncbi:hypothetical protein CCACVL1_08344 [Corchorus capsularis]|uniref:Uncharacterized protein n=1 Tax=Corchorus capsularis TaxID=210143 RepID=A0A1R3J0Y6_COCAP|nr:hypothetical protein CCACVL1_08344 [Corchorus capsularis]